MDPTLIAFAKAYAYRLELGKTPAQAEAYAEKHFPGATPEERALAIKQANQALSVGYNLNSLPLDAQLQDALLGATPPAPTVGVRVEISRQMGDVNKAGQRVPRRNTVYLPMNWTDTPADVLHSVEQYVQDHWMESGEPESTPAFIFSGPTLWPLT